MAHSKVKNGGQKRAAGVLTREQAYGKQPDEDVILTSLLAAEDLPLANKMYTRGAYRCPNRECNQVNHGVHAKTHVCTGCNKGFRTS
jgi:hypothetical protein